jgi:small subunit ribosomal protein S4
MIKSNDSYSRKYCVEIWGDAKDKSFKKRPYKKGQHGRTAMSKNTPDAKARKHAQILKIHYGLSEKDFRILMSKAKNMKGNIIDNIAVLLESCPMIIAYRAKLSPTMFSARQMVSHRNVLLNGKKCFRKETVKAGDVISIPEKIKSSQHFINSIANLERPIPDYISSDTELKTAKFLRNPSFRELYISKLIDINGVVSRYTRMI